MNQKCISLLIILLSLFLLQQVSGNEKPNIIFIMADDLGYADISPYGQDKISTPYLQSMAEKGIRFTQHYAGSNVCAPTRCSLMTGHHQGNAFIRGNLQHKSGEGQLPIPSSAVTIAEALKQVGYTTGMFGKWGLGNPGTSGDPLKQGWDTYVGYADQVRAHNFFPDFLLHDGERVPLANEVKYLSKSAWHKGIGSYSTGQNVYSHDVIVEEAFKFVRKNKDKPFFLYLPFTLPHDNGEAPVLYNEVPDFGSYKVKERWSLNTKGYAEMVTRLDKSVGQLNKLLQELKIDENTLVVFTSDNGPLLPRTTQKDRLYTDFFDSNGIYRGHKREFYEGGIRMPFIALWPGKIKAGSASDHISAHWDFFATACDLAGAAIPKDIDGISYLPTLLGKDKAQTKHEFLYWEGSGGAAGVALRMGKWKGVIPKKHNVSNPQFEIYDLEKDPEEQNNIADKHPELQKKFMKLAKETRSTSKHFPISFLDN
ncbi:MAG: arylsulfatase [Lentisphaeraceae bacterium]|nr:arylsulfatase [Lentisphaeraceae bacterium]